MQEASMWSMQAKVGAAGPSMTIFWKNLVGLDGGSQGLMVRGMMISQSRRPAASFA